MNKININDLEKLDKYDPNYYKNPLIDGLEDMNSEVKDTVAAIALNRFGFAMDQLAEQRNYPYINQEAAIESILDNAFNDPNTIDFICGLETEKPGVLTRIWNSIKSFFNRIFDFIFGKGNSDKTSIRYYARVLKDKIAAMMGKGKQNKEQINNSDLVKVSLIEKAKEIVDRNKNTQEGIDIGAGESMTPITSPIETMEILNKITPQIHLVGQLLADAMSSTYTEDAFNSKIGARLNQMEKSYREYETALKSIQLSSISLDGLSASDLNKLYNQTTKFEMLWKQFESTRKLVNSISIEDMQRKMFSKEGINILMTALRKVQNAVLTIRTVVRSLIGKMSSGNESDDYYFDVFDIMSEEGVEVENVAKLFLGASAAIAGGYVVYKILDKLWKWFQSRGKNQIEAASKAVQTSKKETVQVIEKVKANKVQPEQNQSHMVKILYYNRLGGSRSPLLYIKQTLLGIQNIMVCIQAGNFTKLLGELSQTSNITRLKEEMQEFLSLKQDIDLNEYIIKPQELNTLMESLVSACDDFSSITIIVKNITKFQGMKPPQDKFDALPTDKQNAITAYLNNLPQEISTIVACYNQLKNELVSSNNTIRESLLGFMSVDTRIGVAGKPIKGRIRDIIDENAIESEDYYNLDFDYDSGVEADLLKIIGGTAIAAGAGYALYKIIPKILKWIEEKGSKKAKNMEVVVTKSTEQVKQVIQQVQKQTPKQDNTSADNTSINKEHNNPEKDTNVNSSAKTQKSTPKSITILDYEYMYRNKIMDAFETELRPIYTMMVEVANGNVDNLLSFDGWRGRSFSGVKSMFHRFSTQKETHEVEELKNDTEYLKNILLGLGYVCEGYQRITKILNAMNIKKYKKMNSDKIYDLSRDEADKFKTYITEVPKVIDEYLQLADQFKNEIIKSNNLIIDALGDRHINYSITSMGSDRDGKTLKEKLSNIGVESEIVDELKELDSLISQYQLSCESESWFGLESGNDKPGMLRKIWNAIIKFFNRLWSQITRKGYRAKEIIKWNNTKVNKGYEDEIFTSIPIKYAEIYKQYVDLMTKKVEPYIFKSRNGLMKLVHEPTNDNAQKLNTVLMDYIDVLEKVTEIIPTIIPQQDMTATEILKSMKIIEDAYADMEEHNKRIKYGPNNMIVPNKDQSDVNPSLLQKLQKLMEVAQYLMNICTRFENNMYSIVNLFHSSIKIHSIKFANTFGPIDRSKVKKQQGSTESLEYLLSL